MTASVIVSIVALILCASTSVAIAVLVSRALATSFRALDRMNARWAQQQEKLLDRFQAIRWEDLAALRAIDEPAEGGFIVPEDQVEDGGQELPRPQWGALRALRDTMTEDEQALLDEDFEEEAK